MTKPDTVSFNVTLPRPAIKLIAALIPRGLHGSTRAEIARSLILDQLKVLVSQGLKEAEEVSGEPDEG